MAITKQQAFDGYDGGDPKTTQGYIDNLLGEYFWAIAAIEIPIALIPNLFDSEPPSPNDRFVAISKLREAYEPKGWSIKEGFYVLIFS